LKRLSPENGKFPNCDPAHIRTIAHLISFIPRGELNLRNCQINVRNGPGALNAWTAIEDKNMTTHHSTITKLTKSLNEIFLCISHTTGQYNEAKVQGVRLAHLNKVLSALDPHILKDIGMEGFDRLSPAQKVRALLKSKQSQR
jgi:hypothetical protein